jgi:nicotinate-nucleotide pyrophosphorylase (carboxylating)
MGILAMDEMQPYIDEIVARALAEDLGACGDVTTQAIFTHDATASATIVSKGAGVLCGAFLLEPIFGAIDPDLAITNLLADSAKLQPGVEICRLSGRVHSILAGERVALNFLQRLSGIATQTARLVELTRETKAVILDTRKTTPLLRRLEKRAVLAGGGRNHRFGLFDMILIKDTHVKAAGGVQAALRKAAAFRRDKPGLAIEVEVQSEAEFLEAVACAPDRIMLDNMDCAVMRRCVRMVREHNIAIELEASGNVNSATVRAIAETGVDFISVGSITHSVSAVDIHLLIV